MSHPGKATRLHDAFHVIVDAVRRGLPPKTACALADVSRQTFYRWMSYGDQEIAMREAEQSAQADEILPKTYEDGQLRSQVYADFYTHVLRARSEVALQAVENLLEAGKDPRHWPANAWFLERTHPEEFAQTTRMELTGRGGGPVLAEQVSPDRQEEMARRVLEQAAIRKRRALPAPPVELEVTSGGA